MPDTTASTAAAVGWSRTAAGVPHMPRATWANWSAVSESRMTTDASGPTAAHSPLTAVSSPAPIRRNAIPRALRCRPDPEALGLEPRSRLVSMAGMSSETAQQEATMPEVRAAPPRWPASSRSQAAAQMAARISPGSTNGTSRRLAHG